jgi:hypothetical protein
MLNGLYTAELQSRGYNTFIVAFYPRLDVIQQTCYLLFCVVRMQTYSYAILSLWNSGMSDRPHQETSLLEIQRKRSSERR